jgi:HEAT repeat protein
LAQGHAWWAAGQHWDPSLKDLLDAALKRADIEDDGLRHRLIEIAATADGSDGALIAHLQDAVLTMTKDRRIQLVVDLMATALDGDPRKDSQTIRRARAEKLAAAFDDPEAEIARALIGALSGDELKPIGNGLSEAARAAVAGLLPTIAPNVLGPLTCIAATTGVSPLDAVRRLLATENTKDGELAVQALRIFGEANTKPALEGALSHPKYAVRRAALTALVAIAEVGDRQALTTISEDPSADVRLAWADMMKSEKWPEAVESLVGLLSDRRDFSIDRAYGLGQGWAQHRVGRAAAAALAAYEVLPSWAIDGLLAAAAQVSADPFVACAALSALANKDDDRITPALMVAIESPGLPGSPLHRPLAQAAAWALFDRAVARKLGIDGDKLAVPARDGAPEVAGPLLMTMSIVGGGARDALLADLRARHRNERVALLEVAAAAVNMPTSVDPPMVLLERLAAGEQIDQFQTEERDQLENWSRGLDVGADVSGTTAWLLSAVFHLPVPGSPQNPRAFILPKRIRVLTMRSLSPSREEFQGLDDGF